MDSWIETAARVKADEVTKKLARFLLNLFVWTLVPYYVILNFVKTWRETND